MDRSASEYAQSDQSSAATYSNQTDPRSGTISSHTTPQSDYGITPSSARSSGFPQDHLARYSHYSHAPPGAVGTMAQPSSPSISSPKDHQSGPHPHDAHSNSHVPIDPSISQASPTYPPYSPYGPQPGQEMPPYPPHQPQHMYRPPHDWPSYPPQHGMPGQYQQPPVHGPPQPNAPNRPGQVYSFVPIPGAQQHKRPRRRYEEIERMYKCGWNGCEKAYGTLNHLNAHVTMQSHGTKRTPEELKLTNQLEFKEIRKEWKARKKEEENARKADEDRQRQAQQQAQQGVDGPQSEQHQVPNQGYQQNGARPSLPPIGYQAADAQGQGQYGQQPGNMVYPPNNSHMQYANNYPNSPYAQQGQVYQQREYHHGSAA